MGNRFLLLLVTMTGLLRPLAAQFLPPAKRAAHVQITHGPELERADADFAIIRWTSNNPGGSDKHYGVVHYGASSKNLSEYAKSPIRLNRGHTATIFRVRVEGLKPATTYYYTVDSHKQTAKVTGCNARSSTSLRRWHRPAAEDQSLLYFASDTHRSGPS